MGEGEGNLEKGEEHSPPLGFEREGMGENCFVKGVMSEFVWK